MFGCSPLWVMAPRPCQKPVTGPPGSARALNAILIDGWSMSGTRPCSSPQAVFAPVPVSLAAVGNSSPRTGYKQALTCPIIFQGASEVNYPLTNKVMARAFWSAFGQVFKENFSTKSPVFRAGAAPDGERLFWEGRARHMPLVRFSR